MCKLPNRTLNPRVFHAESKYYMVAFVAVQHVSLSSSPSLLSAITVPVTGTQRDFTTFLFFFQKDPSLLLHFASFMPDTGGFYLVTPNIHLFKNYALTAY